jgi:RNA polymerase sigma-70 factor (ECF subfamily)
MLASGMLASGETICERAGSFAVEDAIQGRDHSLLGSRTVNRTSDRSEEIDADAHLIERLARREEHAFLSLYDRYSRSLFRFLLHMTGSVAAAEELTQEVFVVILDLICAGTIGKFDPAKGTLEGYLLGIGRNLARQERRKADRLLPLDGLVESPEWNLLVRGLGHEFRESDAESEMVAHSELKALYRAILGLPSHYREVVVLCSLQEKSYEDAATILQCSEGTIASRMSRAKRLLAARMRRSDRHEAGTSQADQA